MFLWMKSPLFYPKLFLQKNLSNQVIKTKKTEAITTSVFNDLLSAYRP